MHPRIPGDFRINLVTSAVVCAEQAVDTSDFRLLAGIDAGAAHVIGALTDSRGVHVDPGLVVASILVAAAGGAHIFHVPEDPARLLARAIKIVA